MRKPRTIAQGITYHCYSRCYNQENRLISGLGKQIFIESVQMCQEKYYFELCAAEIVGNHIHLIIKTLEGGETISRIMQYIKARVAEKYNRIMKMGGAFWCGRFNCKVIEESNDPVTYLLWLLWYVAYNTVRKNLCTDPRQIQYNTIGFINCYLIENYQDLHNFPIKITLHPFFLKIGNNFAECVEKFLYYEELYLARLTA